MSVNKYIFFQILVAAWLFPVALTAQISHGGIPCTYARALAPDNEHFNVVAPPDMDRVMSEDALEPVPYRFAVNLAADLDVCLSGTRTVTGDGMIVYRLNIQSPGARALVLYFDRFRLPAGGKVFVYNPGRTQLLGAFTDQNNNLQSTFATGLVYGDQVTVEYNAPDGLPLPLLHISEVGHAYRGVAEDPRAADGFGNSGNCEVNVNCNEGATWQNEKRSVARIAVKRGAASVWCTGSLLNNVRNDGTPYLLTADHCGKYSSETDLSQWIFYFNYETTACPDPTKEPSSNSMTGATLVAHGGNAGASGSDFFLVRLNTQVPNTFNPYFNGWNRETVPPSQSGTCIHHPMGDIKKISTYTAPVVATFWKGGSKLAHWLVTWSKTANGHGTTEGGSSGSPLYDAQGRLIGTLTGGDSSCDTAHLTLPDYYGMFSYSWDKNGTDSTEVLKYWLDPDNTGTMALNGWALAVDEPGSAETVTVYPNPAKDVLNIRLSGPKNKIITFGFYDILGHVCFSVEKNTGSGSDVRLDISRLNGGMYLLSFMDGDRRVVRKVFVEK